jgi:ubiquinone/menaquinone biosynthesis C-methylase UbiE
MTGFAIARRVRSLFADLAFLLGHRLKNLSASRLWLTAIQKSWISLEHFDPTWARRIEAMAKHVPTGSTVMDLGCGPMWLKETRPDLVYTGVDYKFRGVGCVVADFNKREFPTTSSDVIFISGCLEYIEDPEWFIAQATRMSKRCVVSYCALDLNPDLVARRRMGWVNDLSKAQIEQLFRERRFSLTALNEYSNNLIFVFDRQAAK